MKHSRLTAAGCENNFSRQVKKKKKFVFKKEENRLCDKNKRRQYW